MSQATINESASSLDLSIVIVSWNTRDLLAQCLESVLDNIHSLQNMRVETLVVDNNSNDGSVQMIQERFPWVQLIDNKKNVGFAGGNNQAIRQSKGRYVLLLNPDTKVKSDALGILIRFMEEHPHVGATGPLTLNPDGTLQTSCYPVPTLSRELWRLLHLDLLWPYGVYHMTTWDRETPRDVDVLLGACLLLRRVVLDQIGLLDEDYFIYSEEVDLCHRLQKANWRLYWVPQAQIIHYGGQSTQQVATEMFLQLYQGKTLYFHKHHGWLAAQAYKLILLATALIRLLLSPLAWLERPSRRQRHLTLANRYWQLVKTLPSM